MGWVSPTSHYEDTWINEANAYDEDTGTYAESRSVSPESWSDEIQFFHSAILCNKIRFWADGLEGKFDTVRIEIQYDGSWHSLYEGSFNELEWDEEAFGQQMVTGIQFEFYNVSGGSSYEVRLHEVDFWEVEGASRPLVGGSLASGRKGLVC